MAEDRYTGTHKFGYGPNCVLCGARRLDVEDWLVPKDCPQLNDDNRDLDPFVVEAQIRR